MRCNLCHLAIRTCPHCGAYLSATDGVLQVLRETMGAVHGTRIADMTGWSKSEVYRQLADLRARGLVEQVGRRKGYRLVDSIRFQVRQEVAALAA